MHGNARVWPAAVHLSPLKAKRAHKSVAAKARSTRGDATAPSGGAAPESRCSNANSWNDAAERKGAKPTIEPQKQPGRRSGAPTTPRLPLSVVADGEPPDMCKRDEERLAPTHGPGLTGDPFRARTRLREATFPSLRLKESVARWRLARREAVQQPATSIQRPKPGLSAAKAAAGCRAAQQDEACKRDEATLNLRVTKDR